MAWTAKKVGGTTSYYTHPAAHGTIVLYKRSGGWKARLSWPSLDLASTEAV